MMSRSQQVRLSNFYVAFLRLDNLKVYRQRLRFLKVPHYHFHKIFAHVLLLPSSYILFPQKVFTSTWILGARVVFSHVSISLTIIVSAVNVICASLRRTGPYAAFNLDSVCDMTTRFFPIFKTRVCRGWSIMMDRSKMNVSLLVV